MALLNSGMMRVSGRLAANEPGLVKASVLEGQGIALLRSAVASGELNTGMLIPVLPELIGADIPVSLVHADREFIDPKVRIFVGRAAEVMLRKMPAPYRLETNRA